jgi:starch synthase
MMHVIQYANDIFKNQKSKWDALMLRAMTTDYSWNNPAQKYQNLYDKLISQ